MTIWQQLWEDTGWNHLTDISQLWDELSKSVDIEEDELRLACFSWFMCSSQDHRGQTASDNTILLIMR
jgi:hypothetical protein